MLNIHKLIVNLYIHLAGVRFYSCQLEPVEKPFRKFIVKTLHGYEIMFSFHKEKRHFIKYFFKSLKKRDCTIYAVTAKFDDVAPETVRAYNSMRIFVNDSTFFLSNEDAIVQTLLKVYLDYLLHEMSTCAKNNIQEVDKVDNITEDKTN